MKMKLNFRKRFVGIAMTVLLLFVFILPVSAAPQESYTYDAWDEEITAPDSYIATNTVIGNDLGVGSFNKASDLFVDKNNFIYISDT